MKSYTDINQSRKLAEILPIESADFHFSANQSQQGYLEKPIFGNSESADYNSFPCWSLAALLEHLRRIDMFPDIIDSVDCVMMDISFADDEDGKVHCLRVEGKTILDACVEMILKLHERKLL